MNRSSVLAFAAASALLVAGCSSADATDKGGAPDSGTEVEVHAAELPSDHAFTVDNATVKAGKVNFTFVNDAKAEHEMIVLKTDTPFDQLVVGADHRVSEDESVGEISETAGGKAVVQSFDLAPGSYVLLCNIALHYGQGMRLAFTVTN